MRVQARAVIQAIHPLASLIGPYVRWAWYLVRLSLFVSDARHFLCQIEFHVLRARIRGLEVTLLENRVTGVGHSRPLGEWLSEAQSAKNGRTTVVVLPGGLWS